MDRLVLLCLLVETSLGSYTSARLSLRNTHAPTNNSGAFASVRPDAPPARVSATRDYNTALQSRVPASDLQHAQRHRSNSASKGHNTRFRREVPQSSYFLHRSKPYPPHPSTSVVPYSAPAFPPLTSASPPITEGSGQPRPEAGFPGQPGPAAFAGKTRPAVAFSGQPRPAVEFAGQPGQPAAFAGQPGPTAASIGQPGPAVFNPVPAPEGFPSEKPVMALLTQTIEDNSDGTFTYSFELENGISVRAKGYLKEIVLRATPGSAPRTPTCQ